MTNRTLQSSVKEKKIKRDTGEETEKWDFHVVTQAVGD